MCLFVLYKGPKRRAHFCAKCHREGPALYGISTVVEKEVNQLWFPGEQDVCKRDSLDIATVGQKQFDEI
jgi:hypothetical protein